MGHSLHEAKLNQIIYQRKQGRIHGNPVADIWAGAVMKNRSKLKNIMDRPTNLRTKQQE